jgi:hypothetical protein
MRKEMNFGVPGNWQKCWNIRNTDTSKQLSKEPRRHVKTADGMSQTIFGIFMK